MIEHLQHLRVEEAKCLLEAGGMPVDEISFEPMTYDSRITAHEPSSSGRADSSITYAPLPRLSL